MRSPEHCRRRASANPVRNLSNGASARPRAGASAVLGRAFGRWHRAVCFVAAAAAPALSAATWEPVAGTGEKGFDGDGGPARQAKLDEPFGVVRGPDGALWFADYGAHVIRRIGTNGVIETRVGNGRAAYQGDGGPGRAASLQHPHELRFAADGSLFIADTDNHVIRRYDPQSGQMSTWLGTGQAGYAGDGGPATAAQLRAPISLQFAPNGDLFVAEIGNHVIRRVDARTRLVSTLVGTGRPGPTPEEAPLTGTPVQGPRSLDVDGAGRLWLATREGNQVFRIDLAVGNLRWVAGTGAKGFSGDGGPARRATFSGPKGIAIAPTGDIYLADTENHAIRRIDPSRDIVDRVAGLGPGAAAGAATSADLLTLPLDRPHGVFVDRDGTVFVGDSENHRIVALRGGASGTRP